ncbi:MAG: type II toxin-antitoxin system RelE/ParE family toxin [Acidaminococcaceae bacterium]|jgi:plasmid stabilization system protein ParE|nr:type II toxin-antitoxin system RelE/ParE family toxin [Acidaminococcaceae bacterium]
MIYKVELSALSITDLRGIYEYIAFNLKVPEHARTQYERIESKIFSLEKFPNRYKPYEDNPWNGHILRRVVVDKYIVFYYVENNLVMVVRVIYCGRNIKEQLSKHGL